MDGHSQLKCCNKCKTLRPLTDYWRDKSTADGRRGMCNQCVNINRPKVRRAPGVVQGRGQLSYAYTMPREALNWFRRRNTTGETSEQA